MARLSSTTLGLIAASFLVAVWVYVSSWTLSDVPSKEPLRAALVSQTVAKSSYDPPAAVRISEGVTKQILKKGDGIHFPVTGNTVLMHYTGTLADRTKFDSSVDRNQPFETRIGVGQVIKGWDEGVPTMSLGEKAVLVIEADWAYGDRGYPPIIPPKSQLIFEVELLKIKQ
ncbi:Peptidylprolyl isomerase [Obelidium mucronatum]|nr:Peptidylprolyl isomerase [Obelidium mucronatum]